MIPFGDIGSHIESVLGGPVVGVRYAPSTRVKGDWTPGVTSPLSFTASVQPITPRETLQLPENERARAAIVLFTTFALRASDVNAQTQADEVTWRGFNWRVVLVEDWGAQVNYYRAVAVRIGE